MQGLFFFAYFTARVMTESRDERNENEGSV